MEILKFFQFSLKKIGVSLFNVRVYDQNGTPVVLTHRLRFPGFLVIIVL